MSFLSLKKQNEFRSLVTGLVFLLFIISPIHASELQVGVSPLLLNLGILERGESVVGSFFIVTSSPDEIIVKLESVDSNFDFFRKPENLDIADKVSEEKSFKWVFFPDNPYVLKPNDDSLNTVGGMISGWRKVNFVLNIPDDAEPCYHAFKILPTPYSAKDEGTAVNIVAMMAITVKFKVEGECVVSGNILDVMQDESLYGDGVDIYFQNTGSATVSAVGSEIKLLSLNGTLIDTIRSNYGIVSPKGIVKLNAKFNRDKIVPGDYLLNATVVYGINSTSKQIPIYIIEPKYVPNVQVKTNISKGSSGSYLLILLIIILIIAYKIYKKDD